MSFSGSPRLVHAALVAVSPTTGAPLRRVAFQYNPDQLTRTLQIEGDPQRAGLPPPETLRVELELDATDILEKSGPPEAIDAQLAALEALIGPSNAQLTGARALAARGTLEILAPDPPNLLFVFGGRSVPVKITEYSVVEEAFDPALRPIRAKVTLGMRVNSEGDAFLTHHRAREQLSRRAGRTTR